MKNKSITKNFIFNTVKTIMVVIFPLISFPYVSRVLGVEGIGAVQYCTSVIQYFALLASLGIATYAVREGVRYRDDKKKFAQFALEIFVINMCSTLITYGVLIGCIIAGVFKGYETLMLISSLYVIFTTLAVEWIYQIMEEYVYISLRTTLFQFFALIAMFIFVRSSQDTAAYALITVLASGGFCFLNLIYAFRFLDFSAINKLQLRRHLKSILIIFGTAAAVTIYTNMDIVMLNIFFGDYETGLYTAAMKVMIVIKNIIASISVVVLPRISYYIARGDKENSQILIRTGTNINIMISIPCGVGLMLTSWAIIYLFSGPAFLEADLAAKILGINVIFAAINNIFYNQILIPNNKEKIACLGTVIGAAANLILNWILIPLFTINGAAVATLVSECSVFVFSIIFVRKLVDLRNIFDKLYTYIIAIIPMIIVVELLKHLITKPALFLICAVPLAALIYFAGLIILKNDILLEALKGIQNKFLKTGVNK